MRQITGQLVLGAVAAGAAVGTAWLGASAPLRGQAAAPEAGPAVAARRFVGAEPGSDWAPRNAIHVPSSPMTAAATRVWLKLQEPVAFHFPNETPLSRVLQYVRESTKDPRLMPKGIAFYLDPLGLETRERTPESPVTIDLEDVPLATTLKLALAQLGLQYTIHPDGFVLISDGNTLAPDEANALILDQLADLRIEIFSLHADLARRSEPAGGGGMSGGMQGPTGGMSTTGGMRSVPPGR